MAQYQGLFLVSTLLTSMVSSFWSVLGWEPETAAMLKYQTPRGMRVVKEQRGRHESSLTPCKLGQIAELWLAGLHAFVREHLCAHQVLLAYLKTFEMAQSNPRRARKRTKTDFLKTTETWKIAVTILFEHLINVMDPGCRKMNTSIHAATHMYFRQCRDPLKPTQKHECPTQKERGPCEGPGWTWQLFLDPQLLVSAGS